ncbi:MAG: sensor histidine kinase, partial [Candidatus Acidiferrales bacterium]
GMFFISYGLVNRTLILMFPRPLEIANEQSQKMLSDLRKVEKDRLDDRAEAAVSWLNTPANHGDFKNYAQRYVEDLSAVWVVDPSGKVTATSSPGSEPPSQFKRLQEMSSGAELWMGDGKYYLAGRASYENGWLMVGHLLPADFYARLNIIKEQSATYESMRQQIRIFKKEIVAALLLGTLLLLFSATWMALFLSKQVTIPIEALAAATQEVAQGNMEYRVKVQAQDELGTLVASFNQMTAQLGESRRQIDEFTRSLQIAIEENERRRKVMEAILENIPTGVLSLDPSGVITRTNSALARIFGDHAKSAQNLADLVGEEAARDVLQLMRRSLRMGAASRELEIAVAGRPLHAAVTVSSLGPRRSNPGFVVVMDDLTELLRAQKAAAWQEVAQRIAHEIKNPLTPIQLSAQRMLRHLERNAAAGRSMVQSAEFEKVAAECAVLIEREVQTLESLVDEFSQFARFPSARLAPADLNGIVASALEVFQGRLEGIELSTTLAAALPLVRADSELLRRVMVNLIDNAAEAMEGSKVRRLTVATRVQNDGDSVEVEIADSGYGISPEDKDKLFLPHFSTKERGTGLGLAIASRIVAEHNGTMRVMDNIPAGARFVIRFPVAEVPAAQGSI